MEKNLAAIVIHGGAGPKLTNKIQEERVATSLKNIVRKSYEKLVNGESAIQVAVFAASMLEDDPQFNAGTGGKLQSDGVARLSCSLMDGFTSKFSGVINLESTKNPIQVAQKLLNEKDRVLSGEGAQKYARSQEFSNYNPITPESLAEWKDRKERNNVDELTQLTGTIGVVCVDLQGRTAAATSTGGKGMEIVGRVSDSATVAGNFASANAAVSCTGVGEELVESAVAVKIVTRVDDGASLEEAFKKTFSEFRNRKGRGAAIGVDKNGNVYVDFTTECILHAIKTHDIEKMYP